MRACARRIYQVPFDLETGPVWRLLVCRLRGNLLGVGVIISHIASDGWSIARLLDELNCFCRAYAESTEPRLAELPVQYADYAVWQRQWLQGERLERELAYWKQRLAGMPPALDLPLDCPRPPVQTFNGGRHRVDLPEAVAAGIAVLGQRHRVTLVGA